MIKFMGPFVAEMLQLYTSSSFNIVALLPDVTSSITGSMNVILQSDYTQQTSSLTCSISNNDYYLIANIVGNTLPTASGLYSLGFYSGSTLICSERAFIYGTTQETLTTYTGSVVPYFYQYNS